MPQSVTVSATRSITWRSDVSRSGVPRVPRKYFWATMLVAFCDHVVGNSTSDWKKASPPSLKFGMRESRRSHSTVSYGSVPAVVNRRRIPIPSCWGALAMCDPSLCERCTGSLRRFLIDHNILCPAGLPTATGRVLHHCHSVLARLVGRHRPCSQGVREGSHLCTHAQAGDPSPAA